MNQLNNEPPIQTIEQIKDLIIFQGYNSLEFISLMNLLIEDRVLNIDNRIVILKDQLANLENALFEEKAIITALMQVKEKTNNIFNVPQAVESFVKVNR